MRRTGAGTVAIGTVRRALAASLAASLVALASCHRAPAEAPVPAVSLVDAGATAETRALFINLRRQAGRGVLFGHEHDLAYGVTWFHERGRSDVKESSGSYPAVYGWDVNSLFARGPNAAGGETEESRLRAWIAEGFARGGVITMEWHQDNFASKGSAWDTTRAVSQLLPGAPLHAAYLARLDTVAAFFRTLRGRDRAGHDVPIPVIFRPFHEMSGSWFWWGDRHRTPQEFVTLWRMTVDHLRSRGVHNLLYAYTPDVFADRADFLAHYPGDGYADVLGFDDYQSVRSPATRAVLARRLRELVTLADERDKVAALTETGIEALPDSLFWTGTLLPALTADSIGRRVAYLLVWRNANRARERRDHFYASYPGHASAADFRRFRDDPFIVFEDELPDMYHVRPPSSRR